MKPYYEQDGIRIYHGDAAEVCADLGPVADVVITDPPYPAEFDHVWDILGGPVVDSMKPDTFLTTLLGHYQLPRVIDALGRRLRFYWLAITENNQCPIMHGYRVKVNYKPCLVYANGKPVPRRVWRDNFLVANQVGRLAESRNAHKWGQTPTCFQEPIDAFSEPGGVVLDPFLGGGSVLVAARDMGRRGIGIEIEERTCEIAANRLAQGVLF